MGEPAPSGGAEAAAPDGAVGEEAAAPDAAAPDGAVVAEAAAPGGAARRRQSKARPRSTLYDPRRPTLPKRKPRYQGKPLVLGEWTRPRDNDRALGGYRPADDPYLSRMWGAVRAQEEDMARQRQGLQERRRGRLEARRAVAARYGWRGAAHRGLEPPTPAWRAAAGGDFAELRKLFDSIAESQPGQGGAVRKAQLVRALRDGGEACRALRVRGGRAPDDPWPFFWVGRVWRLMGAEQGGAKMAADQDFRREMTWEDFAPRAALVLLFDKAARGGPVAAAELLARLDGDKALSSLPAAPALRRRLAAAGDVVVDWNAYASWCDRSFQAWHPPGAPPPPARPVTPAAPAPRQQKCKEQWQGLYAEVELQAARGKAGARRERGPCAALRMAEERIRASGAADAAERAAYPPESPAGKASSGWRSPARSDPGVPADPALPGASRSDTPAARRVRRFAEALRGKIDELLADQPPIWHRSAETTSPARSASRTADGAQQGSERAAAGDAQCGAAAARHRRCLLLCPTEAGEACKGGSALPRSLPQQQSLPTPGPSSSSTSRPAGQPK
eukprot:TRINITY_DN56672_c0_g1_i1.p1 TRINITY_DN56672_c0_g1~~TRINITY_DN56672_c0_g1_i1.p1  ORF type:complete len:585 (+),score=124.48 TRINITY_DN56672_c0_g1_i1:70-1755(+)